MATKKITELTELATAPANDDELAIVDTDASTTKRISVSNLLTNAGGGGGAATLSAVSSSTYEINANNQGQVITIDPSSNDVAVTIPGGLGNGFYCYVATASAGATSNVPYVVTVQGKTTGSTATLLSEQHAINAQVCLKTGKGAMAKIQNIGSDTYSIEGDIGPFPGYLSLVVDRIEASTRSLHFDDQNGYCGQAYNSCDWNSSNHYPGKVTAAQISGNYRPIGFDGSGYSEIDSAMGSPGISSDPNFLSSGGEYTSPGGYQPYYAYCGKGKTLTTFTTTDTNGGNSITVLPVIFRCINTMSGNETSLNNYWAMSLYYKSSSTGSEVYGEINTSYMNNSSGSYNEPLAVFGQGEAGIAGDYANFWGIHDSGQPNTSVSSGAWISQYGGFNKPSSSSDTQYLPEGRFYVG